MTALPPSRICRACLEPANHGDVLCTQCRALVSLGPAMVLPTTHDGHESLMEFARLTWQDIRFNPLRATVASALGVVLCLVLFYAACFL